MHFITKQIDSLQQYNIYQYLKTSCHYIILLVIWSMHQSVWMYYYTPTFYGAWTIWTQTSSLVY